MLLTSMCLHPLAQQTFIYALYFAHTRCRVMFGFGKGKIIIQLEKYNFSPGESIRGTVTVKLKKQVQAQGATLRLIGEKSSSRASFSIGNSDSSRRSPPSTTYVFDFTQPLDGAKEYLPSQDYLYHFEIKIPQDLLAQPDFGNNFVGTLIKSAHIISNSLSTIRWYLIARLDVPWSVDVSSKVQINIA